MALALTLSILLSCAPNVLSESGVLSTNLELIPEDAALWKESLLWGQDVVPRAGFGYKDNVLLAPASRQGSAFVTSGLDLSIFRLPLDGWEIALNVVGDDVRYFRSIGGVRGEDLVIGSLQGQKYLRGGWRVGLELRASYVDQVLQEFLTVGGAQAIRAKGHTVGARPFVRQDLSTNWWVQLEAPLAREWWQAPLDASWKFGGQAVLGLNYGSGSQLSIEGGALYMPHDQWLARDAAGAELSGKKLKMWRLVTGLKWEQHWDADRHWLTITRLAFTRTRDNGGGYFDNSRYFLSEELRWHTKDWEAKASVGYGYYDFPVQTVGPAPAPKLKLGILDLNARLERRIYKGLRCFASYEYEQSASDDPISQYHYNLGVGGISWEF